MPCQSCGAIHEGSPDACPDCGGILVTGCIERPAGGTADRRLVTDGGQPTDDESTDGQSTDGQSTEGQSTDGQSTDGQSTGGQSTGGQSTGGRSNEGQSSGGQVSGGHASGGQATDGGQTAPEAAGGQGTPTGSEFDAGDLLAQLPIKAGATIGAFALLIPYLLVTLGSYVPLQRDEFGISAELYATIVGFGPGERFVDLFIGGTDISALRNVDPSDYPSVAAELDAVVATLRTQPEALLLPLYVFAPFVCYLGGRYLAKKYASGDSPLEYARVALALPVGAFPIPLVVGLAFGVEAIGGAVLLGGLIAPLLFGALGGLTVYAFRDYSWGASKAYGWLAAVVGLVVAIVLFPLMIPSPLSFELPQRVLFGMIGFIASANFGVGFGIAGTVIFTFVVAAVVAAGYLRVRRSTQPLHTALDGARLGSSVVLGYPAAVALLAIFMPFFSLVISLPLGMNMAFAEVEPDVAQFTSIVLLAAIFSMLFGAGGGALAIRKRDGQNTQWR